MAGPQSTIRSLPLFHYILHAQLFQYAAVLLSLLQPSVAFQSLTVLPSDSTINYQPPGAWTTIQNPCASDSMLSIARTEDAVAIITKSFSFTAPLWPFPVQIGISIDGEDFNHVVDLQDTTTPFSSPPPATGWPSTCQRSAPRLSFVSSNNVERTIRITAASTGASGFEVDTPSPPPETSISPIISPPITSNPAIFGTGATSTTPPTTTTSHIVSKIPQIFTSISLTPSPENRRSVLSIPGTRTSLSSAHTLTITTLSISSMTASFISTMSSTVSPVISTATTTSPSAFNFSTAGPSASPNTPQASPALQAGSRQSQWTIIIAVLCALLGLLIIFGLVWFLIKKRRERMETKRRGDDLLAQPTDEKLHDEVGDQNTLSDINAETRTSWEHGNAANVYGPTAPLQADDAYAWSSQVEEALETCKPVTPPNPFWPVSNDRASNPLTPIALRNGPLHSNHDEMGHSNNPFTAVQPPHHAHIRRQGSNNPFIAYLNSNIDHTHTGASNTVVPAPLSYQDSAIPQSYPDLPPRQSRYAETDISRWSQSSFSPSCYELLDEAGNSVPGASLTRELSITSARRAIKAQAQLTSLPLTATPGNNQPSRSSTMTELNDDITRASSLTPLSRNSTIDWNVIDNFPIPPQPTTLSRHNSNLPLIRPLQLNLDSPRTVLVSHSGQEKFSMRRSRRPSASGIWSEVDGGGEVLLDGQNWQSDDPREVFKRDTCWSESFLVPVPQTPLPHSPHPVLPLSDFSTINPWSSSNLSSSITFPPPLDSVTSLSTTLPQRPGPAHTLPTVIPEPDHSLNSYTRPSSSNLQTPTSALRSPPHYSQLSTPPPSASRPPSSSSRRVSSVMGPRSRRSQAPRSPLTLSTSNHHASVHSSLSLPTPPPQYSPGTYNPFSNNSRTAGANVGAARIRGSMRRAQEDFMRSHEEFLRSRNDYLEPRAQAAPMSEATTSVEETTRLRTNGPVVDHNDDLYSPPRMPAAFAGGLPTPPLSSRGSGFLNQSAHDDAFGKAAIDRQPADVFFNSRNPYAQSNSDALMRLEAALNL
ncbi:hypothetical protein CVT24_002242 [Panaeolus cyanescens]|uniref:Uncharacterized protein n=1 Tax=Panaeolus cyanescens TaxID=181874 RepID=A0A409YIF4_9AGAR|nr:hypothetical protein CVT24_002242 [Panaeolus cyanescens]